MPTFISVPSYDPVTKKRLGGTAQRARAAARAAGLDPDTAAPTAAATTRPARAATTRPATRPVALAKPRLDCHALNVPAPPVGDVAAVEVWSVQVRAQLAMSVIDADDETTAAINAACKALSALSRVGKWLDKTAAPAALQRRAELGEDLPDLLAATPPTDVAALGVWSYYRCASIAYEAARTADIAAAWRSVASASVLAEIATTACNTYFAAEVQRLEAADAADAAAATTAKLAAQRAEAAARVAAVRQCQR